MSASALTVASTHWIGCALVIAMTWWLVRGEVVRVDPRLTVYTGGLAGLICLSLATISASAGW